MVRTFLRIMVLLLLLLPLASTVKAEEVVEVSTGVDLYNRYVWRGLDIANTPSIQPTLAVGYAGLEIGAWGAYTLSNEAYESDEIDFWVSYSRELENGIGFSLMAIDYYFPNAGIGFFNFNDYDAVKEDTIPDPGAHLIELGCSITGPASFPVTLSAFINVYNDAGNNTYFQLDLPISVGQTDLNLFCGATGGSADNPGYYGTDDFQAINLGVTAARDLVVSETLSIPLTVSFVVNPNEEISHLLIGISL